MLKAGILRNVDWRNCCSPAFIAGVLTVFVPVALVLGRAVADVAVSLAAILFLLDRTRRRDWEWARTPWIAVLLALWFYGCARAFFTPDPADSLYHAFVWLRYIVFAASAAAWILPQERWRTWLLRSIILASGFLAADTILQYATGQDIIGRRPLGGRLTAIYTKPMVGFTIASLFAPGLFGLLDKKKILLSALFGAVCFVAVLMSGERMAAIIAAGAIIVWIFCLTRARKAAMPLALAVLGCGLVLVALKPAVFQRQVESTVTTVGNFGESHYAILWTSALHIAEAYPVFGVGIHNFRTACPDERYGPPTEPGTIFLRCSTHPHNIYLEWLAEGGLVGAAGFVLFVVFLFRDLAGRLLRPGANWMLWGLTFVLAFRFCPFISSTSFFHNWWAIPLWLFVGWAQSFGITARRGKNE